MKIQDGDYCDKLSINRNQSARFLLPQSRVHQRTNLASGLCVSCGQYATTLVLTSISYVNCSEFLRQPVHSLRILHIRHCRFKLPFPLISEIDRVRNYEPVPAYRSISGTDELFNSFE